MNEKTETTTQPPASHIDPASPGTRDSSETWPWMVAGAVFLVAVLIVLALRVLKPRPPQEQPLREGEMRT